MTVYRLNVGHHLQIMLGAGLIKIRGDQCWRDLTCMQTFYETQVRSDVWSCIASISHHAALALAVSTVVSAAP